MTDLLDSLLTHQGEDRILFLSGGPKSHLARQSMFAVGMATRVVITQPKTTAQKKHSPLNGEVIISRKIPPLKATIQSMGEDGWAVTKILQAKDIAEMLRSLQPSTPVGSRWAGALAYDLVQWTQPISLQFPPEEGEILGVLWLVDEWETTTPGISDCEDMPPAKKVEGEISSHSDQQHAEDIERIRASITQGELYQLNLGRTWNAPLGEEPSTIFHRLAHNNPAPFSGYIEAADLGLAIASCSPEILLEVRGTEVMTAPIKGTRPRGSDPDQESLLRRDLVHDQKERAEHRMLVDLERNDIGLVSKPGTVKQCRFDVEAYANVQHLVSQVNGELSEGKDGMDAFQALFPGGSITGCPKTVVCAAIDELEQKPRSFWTGSMGWIDVHTGESTWNILIRTLEARWTTDGWHGTIMAGGGITIESQPEAEVAEAIWKAAALRRACGWLSHDAKLLPKGELGIYPLYLEQKTEEQLTNYGLKIAFIDNLDSFSQNIVHAIISHGCEVEVLDGRGPIVELNYDAVIIGPGPGRPEISAITMDIAKRSLENDIPTLGICLGHQALGLADGMSLIESPYGPVHGVPSKIKSIDGGLLAEGETVMTRYNSLVLSGNPNSLKITSTDNTGLLPMAITNQEKQIYGVQFHPESIGSPEGMALLGEFLQRAAHC